MITEKHKSLGIAFIRTSIVPPVGGFLVTFFLEKGINIDSSIIYTVVTFVMSALYYLVFHGIEVLSQNPKIKHLAGIALGYPAQPKYVPSNLDKEANRNINYAIEKEIDAR